MLNNVPNTQVNYTDNFIDKLNLKNKTCCLKHGPEGMEVRVPPAVDFLCQYLGFKENNEATALLRVPICEECAEGLYNPEWLLVYCVSCNSSQWIFKPKASIKITGDMIWLDECPECKEV